MRQIIKSSYLPPVILTLLIAVAYWQFFLLGKIPAPMDTLVGAYFPWLDYKWGFSVGVPVKNALISDVFSQFFIWKYLIVDLIKKGELPLWNIYSFSGTPILGTYHSSVFNPFNLLLFLPKYYGWGFYIFGQSLAAALGMYFFLGSFIKNSAPKLIGSIVFTFSGLMTTWTEFGTGVWAAAMIPWTLFFLDKFYSEKKVRYLLASLISLTILFLSGHAQLTIYSIVLISLYVIFFKGFKNYWYFLAVLVFSLGICMVQFLPAYDLTKSSVRSSEAYSSSYGYGLNPGYEFIRLFAADFFGNPTTYNHWDDQSYHEQSSFIGTLSLPLIAIFYYRRFRSKAVSFWGAVFLVSLFLAFRNPLTLWFYSLPLPFLTYSSASRTFFLTSLSTGILVAFAVNTFSEGKDALFNFRKTATLFFAGCVGIFIGLLATKYILGHSNQIKDVVEMSKNINVSIKNFILPTLLSFAWVVILVFRRFFKVSNKIIVVALLLMFFFDLSRYFLKYNPFVSQSLVFPETPVIKFLKEQPGLFRIARVDKEVMPPNTWTFYKLQSVEGYDPLTLENYGRYFNLVKNQSFNDKVNRYVELTSPPTKFINALNVKYFLAVKRDKDGVIPGELLNYQIRDLGYKRVFEEKTTVVLENPNFNDRAFFVENVVLAKDSKEFLGLISNKDFDPVKTALLLGNDKEIPDKLSKGKVDITNYSDNRLSIKTLNQGDGFLIVSNTYDKGWKLQMNGQKQSLLEVNGGLQGFFVPGGENNFELFYYPDSVDLGVKISLLSMLGVLLAFLYSLKKKIF